MTKATKQVYPQKKLFAHVIGYNSKTKMGVEAAENYYLLSETDNIFDQISTDLTGEKADGHNVYTTLDTTLQRAAYNALRNNKGAVIVMDVSWTKYLPWCQNRITIQIISQKTGMN